MVRAFDPCPRVPSVSKFLCLQYKMNVYNLILGDTCSTWSLCDFLMIDLIDEDSDQDIVFITLNSPLTSLSACRVQRGESNELCIQLNSEYTTQYTNIPQG